MDWFLYDNSLRLERVKQHLSFYFLGNEGCAELLLEVSVNPTLEYVLDFLCKIMNL